MSTKLHDTDKIKQSHRFRLVTLGRLIGTIEPDVAKQQLKDLLHVEHLGEESLEDAIRSLLSSGVLEEQQLAKIHEFTGLVTAKAESFLVDRQLPQFVARTDGADNRVTSRLAAPPNMPTGPVALEYEGGFSESLSKPETSLSENNADLASTLKLKSRSPSSKLRKSKKSSARGESAGKDRSRSRKSERRDSMHDLSWDETWDSKLIRILRHAPERALRAVPPLSVKVWDWCKENPKIAWPGITTGMLLLVSPLLFESLFGSNSPPGVAKSPSLASADPSTETPATISNKNGSEEVSEASIAKSLASTAQDNQIRDDGNGSQSPDAIPSESVQENERPGSLNDPQVTSQPSQVTDTGPDLLTPSLPSESVADGDSNVVSPQGSGVNLAAGDSAEDPETTSPEMPEVALSSSEESPENQNDPRSLIAQPEPAVAEPTAEVTQRTVVDQASMLADSDEPANAIASETPAEPAAFAKPSIEKDVPALEAAPSEVTVNQIALLRDLIIREDFDGALERLASLKASSTLGGSKGEFARTAVLLAKDKKLFTKQIFESLYDTSDYDSRSWRLLYATWLLSSEESDREAMMSRLTSAGSQFSFPIGRLKVWLRTRNADWLEGLRLEKLPENLLEPGDLVYRSIANIQEGFKEAAYRDTELLKGLFESEAESLDDLSLLIQEICVPLLLKSTDRVAKRAKPSI
ncbi:MAG: hypothetical protein ACE361_09290 [Aureliella sp.]